MYVRYREAFCKLDFIGWVGGGYGEVGSETGSVFLGLGTVMEDFIKKCLRLLSVRLEAVLLFLAQMHNE